MLGILFVFTKMDHSISNKSYLFPSLVVIHVQCEVLSKGLELFKGMDTKSFRFC